MTPVHICAIFKNESLYLREWITYHEIVGVEKFHLYQNNSDDDYMSVLQPFIDRGLVEVIPWNVPNPSQFSAYWDNINKHKSQDVWMSFTDCDEFLLPVQHNTISEALAIFPESWGALGVNWCCFGSGGQEKYSPELVTERFTWRGNKDLDFNRHIKSVIKMNQNVHVGGTPHHFSVERGTFSETGEQLHGPWTSIHSSNVLRLNHYSSKSKEEWIKRIHLGKPDRAPIEINWEWYDGRQQMDVDDRDIQRFLPELKRRINET